ncbi:MAG: hypothetical protein ACRDKL_01560 [Solirubrobacteraceae bacterium]
MQGTVALNRAELRRYLGRVGDRWRLDAAFLGGAVVADERGAPPQRERGPEYVVVLVSDAYDAIPWLERVYVAGSLWDALEMGARTEIHCYTRAEFARKRASLPVVHEAVWQGLDLLGEGWSSRDAVGRAGR